MIGMHFLLVNYYACPTSDRGGVGKKRCNSQSPKRVSNSAKYKISNSTVL